MCTLLAFGSSGHHTSCYVPQLVLCFYGLMWLEHFQSYASLHAFLSLVMFSTGTWKRFLQSPPSVSGWQKDLLVWMESSQHGRNHCFLFACLLFCLIVKAFMQFSSRWDQCTWKSTYALQPVFQKFPQCCLWNSANVRLVKDVPLSSGSLRWDLAFLFGFIACMLNTLRVLAGHSWKALAPEKGQ